MADESSKSIKTLFSSLGPSLISALVAVAALAQSYCLTRRSQELSNDQAKETQQIAMISKAVELRTKIIEAREQGSPDTLLRLLEHSLKLIDNTGTYQAFRAEILGQSTADALNSDAKANVNQFDVVINDENQAPLNLSKENLVNQLTSAERLLVSNRLIEMYKQNKTEVLNALINAILPESDKNSYRSNLYIAFTLGRIPGGWEGTDDQARAIEQLKGHRNYRDPTFKKWVDASLDKRIRTA